MDIAIALILSILVACLFRNQIKSRPYVFYLLAALAVAAFAALSFSGDIPALARIVYPYIQRCLLAFGFLALVMFIGVLPESSKERAYLAPIRGELSIIASILVAGHVVNYLAAYLGQFFSGFAGMSATMLASFAVSFVLVILLVVLAVTSVQAVRKRMSAASWKRVQRFAYLFFALIFIHVLLILGPSASTLGQKASTSIIVYTVLFGAYCIMRVRKALLDRARRASPVPCAADTER